MTLGAAELRNIVRENLTEVKSKLNGYLRGENVSEIKDIIRRLGRGGELPHWYTNLEAGASMPNLDGKTIGSVIEMTLVGVLEKDIFDGVDSPPLGINPAKGVDIPALGLGVKSPSENYCTSEPFFSAYERLLGNNHDNLVLLTDYQSAKKRPPPVRIQILDAEYLTGSQIADRNLCAVARKNREFSLEMGTASAMKFLQFLCHVNQQDWRVKWLLTFCDNLEKSESVAASIAEDMEQDFEKINKKYERANREKMPEDYLRRLIAIAESNDIPSAIINGASDWVTEAHQEFARMPNSNEWDRYLQSPLDGRIGLSFALQWRYNFGSLFNGKAEDLPEQAEIAV